MSRKTAATMDANAIIDFGPGTQGRQAPAPQAVGASGLGDAFYDLLRETSTAATDARESRSDRWPASERRAPAADEARPRTRSARDEDTAAETRRFERQDDDREPIRDDGFATAAAQPPRDARREVSNEADDAAIPSHGDTASPTANDPDTPSTGPGPATAQGSAPGAPLPSSAAGATQPQGTPFAVAPTAAGNPSDAGHPTTQGPAPTPPAPATPQGPRTASTPAAQVVVTQGAEAAATQGSPAGASGIVAQSLAQAPGGQAAAPATSADLPAAAQGTGAAATAAAAKAADTVSANAATAATPTDAGNAPVAATMSDRTATPAAASSPTPSGPVVSADSADAPSTAEARSGTNGGAPVDVGGSGSEANRAAAAPSRAPALADGGNANAASASAGEPTPGPNGQPVPGRASGSVEASSTDPAHASLVAGPAADQADGEGRSPGTPVTRASANAAGLHASESASAATPAGQKQAGLEVRTGTDNAGMQRATDVVPAPAVLASPVHGGGVDAASSTLPISSGDGITAIGGGTGARAPAATGLADRPAAGQPVPIDQVAVQIRRAAAAGEDRIRIRLHPAELGQIDVQLKVGHDGIVRAVVSIDRAETFDLMQRDARGLERALQDAGLKTDSGSLSFNLRGDGQGSGHGDRQAQTASNGPHVPTPSPADEANVQAAAQASTADVGAGRIDIRV